MREILQRRVVAVLRAFLLQGTRPRQLALCVALALVVGIFPVLGTTTVLCTLAAVSLRLNVAAALAVHYAATPLQLLLIIPFVRLGERVVGATVQPLDLAEGLTLIRHDVVGAIVVLWQAILHAVIGWLAVGPVAVAAIFFGIAPWLERLAAAPRRKSSPGQMEAS
jgi:uncharacterized protein (DUF2062 family)